MREKRIRTVLSFPLASSDGGAVADFTLASDPQGVFQGVMGFTFVQPDLGAALHVRIKQPVNDEERSFHAPDFPERQGQLVLAWI